MTDRGDDIEFDFFDEPETREDARRPRQQRKPSGGGPRSPARPPHGFTPLLRLVGLIAFAILIVVLLVLWVQSCQGAQKHSRYSNYMGKVSTIAHDSDLNGRKFATLMTTPGSKLADIVAGLNGLAQLQQQNVASAEQLRPPGTLRAENTSMVQALQLTVYGLRGLADAFRRTSGYKVDQAAQAGALLAAQAQRLTAADVVWADFFHSPSVAVLKQEGIGGVVVPEMNFVSNPDVASTGFDSQVFLRIHGASTGGTPGGLHGTGIVSTVALPKNQQLSTTAENTVVASADLAFQVNVKDTGDSQEVSIQVTLTIQKSPTPIVKHATIELINPGETRSVVFRDLGQPPFGVKTTVKVDVQPVPGEKSTTNNSAEYPVIFSLGG